MISTQLNFFHSIDDIDLFLVFFKLQGCLLYPYKVNLKDEIKSMHKLGEVKLQTRVEILTDKFEENLKYDYISKQGYHLCSADHSFVIEFSFSKVDSFGNLLPGRFYMTKKYVTEETSSEKDEDFVVWAKKIYALFKKQFLLKNKHCNSWYVTEEIDRKIFEGNLKWGNSFNCLILK